METQESGSIIAIRKDFFWNRDVSRSAESLLYLLKVIRIELTFSARFIRTQEGTGVVGRHHCQWLELAHQDNDPRSANRDLPRHFDPSVLGGILNISIYFTTRREARINLHNQTTE